MKKISVLIIALLTIVSCGKDDVEELKIGSVDLDFVNVIDDAPIVLSGSEYMNGSNELYTISELKYIVSNIVLIKANGEEFTYPVEQSYFLVNEEENNTKKIELSNIPAGEYTKVRFGIGVDQSNYPLNGVANFIPTAEESGMLWSWSAGYKFIKFEGGFSIDGGGTFEDFIIHVGSHGTALDNYKVMTMDLPNAAIVNGNSPTINISADVAKIFDSSNTHSLVEKKDVQVDPVNAPLIAENVSTMFSVTSISQ